MDEREEYLNTLLGKILELINRLEENPFDSSCWAKLNSLQPQIGALLDEIQDDHLKSLEK